MSGIDTSSLMAMRNAILQQNSALQRAAAAPSDPIAGAAPGATQDVGFAGAMRSALTHVNELQAKSSAATEAFERGETTDIAAVMLARQESSIGFQATLQVRNKLLSAYKDIMNMPV